MILPGCVKVCPPLLQVERTMNSYNVLFKDGGIFLNTIAWFIVACEIAFWVVILIGLTTRYVLKKEKRGLFFLAVTPRY
jgi:hypothetical protein